MAQITEIYTALLRSAPKPSISLTDYEMEEVACFELDKTPLLKTLVESKYTAVKYVHIEHLDNEGKVVLNLSFYDGAGEHVGGAELTNTAVFWDDEVADDDAASA